MSCRMSYRMVVATVLGFGALFASDNCWTTTSPASFVTRAEARIGRPFTPLSVAGVARRTTRRAVVAGAVTGAALGYAYGYPYRYGYESHYPSYGSSYPSYSYGSSYFPAQKSEG
jgi:Na+/proline symporter